MRRPPPTNSTEAMAAMREIDERAKGIIARLERQVDEYEDELARIISREQPTTDGGDVDFMAILFDDAVDPDIERLERLIKRAGRRMDGVRSARVREMHRLLEVAEDRRNVLKVEYREKGIGRQELRPSRRKAAEDAVEWLRRHMDRRWLADHDVTVANAFGDRSMAQRSSTRSSFISIAGGPRSVVHELGHVVEFGHSDLDRIFREFVARRTEGGDRIRLGRGYGDGEWARDGGFFAKYVGKEMNVGSEALSMGLEQMWQDPLVLAEDPEHFDLIWKLLRGELP